jgi:hypothetical protein
MMVEPAVRRYRPPLRSGRTFNGDVHEENLQMMYTEYRAAFWQQLRRRLAGLAWVELRERLALPYVRPCPMWTAQPLVVAGQQNLDRP